MTSFLPFGGADLSGVWIVIWVGGDVYFCSCACAAATPPELDADAAFVALEPPEADEVEELDEPHAASARASTSVPKIARYPRARARLLFRRSILESCVMSVSPFGVILG